MKYLVSETKNPETLDELIYTFDGNKWYELTPIRNSSISVGRNTRIQIIENGGNLEDKLKSLQQVLLKESVDKTKEIWNKKFGLIFTYYFSYEVDLDFLVYNFASQVSKKWSSTIRSGKLPDSWNETQLTNNKKLLTLDCTLPGAIQYGRSEVLAKLNENFNTVEFAKTVNNNLDASIELTNPLNSKKELFSPGFLHLTNNKNLQEKIGTSIKREDIINEFAKK